MKPFSRSKSRGYVAPKKFSDVLNVKTAAAYCEMYVPTFLNFVKANAVPRLSTGFHIRFRRADLDAALRRPALPRAERRTVLNARAASAYCGLSFPVFRRLVDERNVPAVTTGKRRLYSRYDLDALFCSPE